MEKTFIQGSSQLVVVVAFDCCYCCATGKLQVNERVVAELSSLPIGLKREGPYFVAHF